LPHKNAKEETPEYTRSLLFLILMNFSENEIDLNLSISISGISSFGISSSDIQPY